MFFREVGNMVVTMTRRGDGSMTAGGIRLCDASVSLRDLEAAKAVQSLQ